MNLETAGHSLESVVNKLRPPKLAYTRLGPLVFATVLVSSPLLAACQGIAAAVAPWTVTVDTECKGTMDLEVARKKAREKANYKGSLDGTKEIVALNNATCGIPDARDPNVAKETIDVCKKTLTWMWMVEELKKQPYDGDWDGRSAIRAYKRAACPQ